MPKQPSNKRKANSKVASSGDVQPQKRQKTLPQASEPAAESQAPASGRDVATANKKTDQITSAGQPAGSPADTSMPSNGPFCLYSTRLPFLRAALIPDVTTGKKDYAALLAKIKSCQMKSDRTAQCFLHFPSGSTKGYGRFRSSCHGFKEPMGDEPYDVGIAGLHKTDNLNLPEQIGEKKTQGVVGKLDLVMPDCGVTSANGSFKMSTVPVWTSPEGEVMYEGYVEFTVHYGLYARKGHGRGYDSAFGFWAIRSREGDALEEGDVAHLANRVGVDAGLGYLDLWFGDEELGQEKHILHPVGSKRYRHWFENYRHSGMSYDMYDSELDGMHDSDLDDF